MFFYVVDAADFQPLDCLGGCVAATGQEVFDLELGVVIFEGSDELPVWYILHRINTNNQTIEKPLLSSFLMRKYWTQTVATSTSISNTW